MICSVTGCGQPAVGYAIAEEILVLCCQSCCLTAERQGFKTKDVPSLKSKG